MKIFSDPLVKRKLICVVLGIVFGFLCFYLAEGGNGPEESLWCTPVMWGILFNRLLLGVMVFLAGFITFHKTFKFRLYPWLRGLIVGAFVSVDLAIWYLMMPDIDSSQKWAIFGMTIVAGAVYGLIIDVVATKLSAEGKDLLNGWGDKK